MSHALDFTTGKAGIAYTGATPWHNLGQVLQPGASLETWQQEAGLDWEALRSNVRYTRRFIGIKGENAETIATTKDHVVLYRSDSGDVLSVVSPKYQPVQPKQVLEFYRDLTEKHGYELETAGSLKDGKRIWALANTKNVTSLRGGDKLKSYLLLATSFDGSMSTQARHTGVRVVCNNTIEIATQGRPEVLVPHSTAFDADKVKLELKIGDAWESFGREAAAMSNRQVNQMETTKFFLDVYYGLDSDEKIKEFQADDKNNKSVERFFERMNKALFNSPGAHMESAKGMLWGIVNAITNDVDFSKPARSQENRLNSAWFGDGAALKQKAWHKALAMV